MRVIIALICMLTLAYAQRISPGDSLQFYCEAEASLSVTRVVGDQGYVNLPVVGNVLVAGKFVAEAEREISDLAAKKLQSDRVHVAISFVSGERTLIEFSGAVRQAGAILYRDGLTLGDVLSQAEPSGSAALEAVEVVSGAGKKTIVDATLEAGKQLLLKRGDRVFVPLATHSREVLILGAVVRPGSVPYEEGLTLAKLVELGGGITPHAEGQIELTRADGEKRSLDVDQDAAFLLLPGDAVTIPVTANPLYVTIRGYVLKPGAVPFRKGMTLTQALKEAGGLSLFSRSDKVVVRRMGEAPYWTGEVELGKILDHEIPDFELHAADVVEVDHQPLKLTEKKTVPAKKNDGHPVVPPR